MLNEITKFPENFPCFSTTPTFYPTYDTFSWMKSFITYNTPTFFLLGQKLLLLCLLLFPVVSLRFGIFLTFQLLNGKFAIFVADNTTLFSLLVADIEMAFCASTFLHIFMLAFNC